MQRINSPDGHFHAGDPSAGIKGTVVTRDFMETLQEELAAIVEDVGFKLDKSDNKQILKAIRKLFADAGRGLRNDADKKYQPLLEYTPVQQGTGINQGAAVVKLGQDKSGNGLRATVGDKDLGRIVFEGGVGQFATREALDKAVGGLRSDVEKKYQAKLGYTPVQQGTGANQKAAAVKLGQDENGDGLRATVADKDLGRVAFESDLSKYATRDWVEQNLASNNTPVVNRSGDEMTGDLTVPNLTSRGSIRAGSACYVGDAAFQDDGNVKGRVWGGDWLSNWVNGQFSARDNNINTRATWDWANQQFAVRDNNLQDALQGRVACDPHWQFMIGWDANAQHVNFSVNGTLVAFVQVNVSDRRRKEDIRLAMDVDALAKIDRAKFYRYKWKNGDGREVFGPIAQQLRAVEPRWVYQVPDTDPLEQPLMLDTLSMQIDAMRAIQQLSGKVRELEKQVAALSHK